MNHVKLFEQFINEARAVKVNLTPEMFDEKSTWGIYKDSKATGATVWKWNSNLLADLNPAGEIPGEKNVVMIQCMVLPSGSCYAYVGSTNYTKREPASTTGANFPFTREDAEKDLKGVASAAAEFLMDDQHFKLLSKNITSNKIPLKIKPVGDFGPVFEKVIEAALKDRV